MKSSAPSPVVLADLVDPHLISRGSDGFSCAIKKSAGGIVRCWGAGTTGQLGDGLSADSLTGVTVSGITNAVSITAGDNFTCALLENRSVKCWGNSNNTSRNLGNGSTVSSPLPVDVVLDRQAVQIDSSDGLTCALLEDGTVACWGPNNVGQIGDGTLVTPAYPTIVSGLSSAVKIAVGSQTACALDSLGTAQCWGLNLYGHLGDGTTNNSSLPIVLQTTNNIKAMSMTSKIACAVLDDGPETAQCWGQAAWLTVPGGNIGATAFPAFDGAVSFSGGYRHMCALMGDATVKCMGYNHEGQIGNGAIAAVISTTPTAVIGLPADVIELQAFEDGACVLTSTEDLWCWGNNGSGQLGNGLLIDSGTPVQATAY